MISLPPLSLYVHIPWCERKCPYCDFNSHAATSAIPEESYISALLDDLEQELDAVHGRELLSIFIGGGTPSLCSSDAIARLLEGIRTRLAPHANLEVTLEANPGSSERIKFREFRQTGVNRLSIGVQSFVDRHLDKLGRVHSGEEARDAVTAARDAGFQAYNLDLMYGLPDQSLEDCQLDIQCGVNMEAPHLSYYQLTIEPNTRFHLSPPPLPTDEETWQMQTELQQQLSLAGYQQYEVSAWSHPGTECRHNLNYWEFGDYIGIGAGAHGKMTSPDGVITRYWKQRHPATYIGKSDTGERIGGSTTVASADLPLEFMMNALRLGDGFKSSLFEERTGRPFSDIEGIVSAQVDRGLLDQQADRIRPTAIGYRFLNTLLDEYF